MSKDKSKPLFVSSFMQETPFHGFNLVANSTNKCEFLTWWLMIFGCICMTAYQTYCLAEYYRSEPTMSLITVRQGHNVTTSNPHVCFTWSFKPDGLGVYGRHIDKILSKVTNEQLHQLKLGNISSEIFPLPIWHLVMEILAEISSQELNVFYGRILQKQIFWGSTLKKQTASSTLNPILHKVSQFFAMRNVSIVQLAKATATVACQIMTVKVAMINYDVIKGKGGTSRPDVCRISAYSSLNRDGFCLFLDSPEHHLTFSNRNDRLQVEFYPQNLYSFYGQTNLSLSGSLAIDLVGGKSVDTLNGYPIFSPYAAHTRTLVDIHGSFKAFSTRRRPCTTVNQWDCRNRCRGEFIYQKCGCWPLIFAGLLSDKKLAKVRFCGDNASAQTVAPPYQIPDLGLCLIEKAIWMTDPAYECQKGCQPDCDHLKLSFTSEIHSGVRCHNCTTQTVQISSFSYPHIEEVMAKSLESLVAEFGGLVGLWMGGSVIAFSHVVIFALKVSQNLCSNGTKRKMGAAQDTIL